MLHTLNNGVLTVAIETFGAEIKSVKRNADEREYMWCGNPEFWGRTSPVLFPFVGAVKNKEYRHNAKTYTMGQHGFARDMEFALLEENGKDKISFALESTEETLAKYPFPFKLIINYELDGEYVKVNWKVQNTGNEKMYFSIGAHPAFMCPVSLGETKEDYSLLYKTDKDKLNYYFINKEGQLVDKQYELKLDEGVYAIEDDSFDTSAYIFENQDIKAVSLLTPAGKEYVTVSFEAPLLGVWSPERKHAPFVCIEPWYGRCDAENYTGELKDRDYENELAVGESFEAGYEIRYAGV